MRTRFCWICIFLCAAFSTNAQHGYLATADSFAAQKKYLESSVYYERILFESNNEEEKFAAIAHKLSSLKQQQKFDEAVTFIHENFSRTMTVTQQQSLKYEALLCSYLSGNFENAISLSTQFQVESPAYKGLLYVQLIKVLSLNELQQWREASSEAAGLIHACGFDSASIKPYDSLPHMKSEKKAQWLATFVPGGGQMYAGKFWEGMASIALQAGAAYFGYYSFREKYYMASWILGLGLAASFHNGSVRRSEVLVKQYNRKQAIKFNEKLKARLTDMLTAK